MSDGNVAADQLRLFIERIERLEEERKSLGEQLGFAQWELTHTEAA